MARILIIDDEPIYHKMIAHALEPLGYEIDTATTGREGLHKAIVTRPDLIITDVIMPEMSGYELTSRLRRDSGFVNIPILVLTSQAELQDKIKAFEAGADDHVTKPFEVEELVARVGVQLRKAEAAKTTLPLSASHSEGARTIAIHSLRGGIGCSTLAVNLAIGLRGLWEAPVLLIDLVLVAGQVALMLNSNLKRTWADIGEVNPADLDIEVVQSVIRDHESKIQFICAPTFPTEAEMMKPELLDTSLKLIRSHYEYIVEDLPHNFGDVSIQALDAANVILLMLAPDMSSVRAAAAALDTYAKLNYSNDRIKLVLNSIFPRQGLTRKQIEAALAFPISMTLPYVPDKIVHAINLGEPLLDHNPLEPISAQIEDFAFIMSKEKHRKIRPESPSPAWKRVAKRYIERRKK